MNLIDWIQIIFIISKITNIIDWNWFVVFLPFIAKIMAEVWLEYANKKNK